MITSLPTKLISAISQRETFIRVLPTRWRRKPAGIEITSRISIQTAGLAFGRHRVKGVDGSCAKHLTVESYTAYTVILLLTVVLIIISSPSPLTLSFQAQNLPFLRILPTAAFLFFFRTDYMDPPDCLLILLSISVFYFLVFFCFTLFSCRFRAVD